ncbi:hypothetical protein ACA910_008117 [Epithemia clementina (nom. ined.)]
MMMSTDNNDDDKRGSHGPEEDATTILCSEWMPLNPESLVAAPCLLEQTLCQPSDDVQNPRLAKDPLYAQAVLDAWKQDEQESEHIWQTEWCHCRYYSFQNDDGDDETKKNGSKTPLYGHLVRRQAPTVLMGSSSTLKAATTTTTTTPSATKAPGIILFHTGAGPHDLFLLYKAAALVNHPWRTTKDGDDDENDDDHWAAPPPVVLVADTLSDDTGWAWDSNHRSRYNQERDQLLAPLPSPQQQQGGNHYHRSLLRQRVLAAIRTIQNSSLPMMVDANRLAVLGWCFGGHPVMEVAKLQSPSIRAMATFHGVFDGTLFRQEDNNTSTNNPEVASTQTKLDQPLPPPEVLICHGDQDPFVSSESLEGVLALLQVDLAYHRTSLLQLAGAKHGFTNPAQDYNDNPAFQYHAPAAHKAWRQTLNMLQRTLFPPYS